MIVSSSGTATSAAGPGLPAVTAYSVNSARSMDRPYRRAIPPPSGRSARHLLEPPAQSGVIAVPPGHGGPDDHLARRPVVPGRRGPAGFRLVGTHPGGVHSDAAIRIHREQVPSRGMRGPPSAGRRVRTSFGSRMSSVPRWWEDFRPYRQARRTLRRRDLPVRRPPAPRDLKEWQTWEHDGEIPGQRSILPRLPGRRHADGEAR